MGTVLSIDLACKRAKDFGICLIKEAGGKIISVDFPSPAGLGLANPPDATRCAHAIYHYCAARDIHVVLLDGPQGWKDPLNGLQHSRVAEKKLNTPAKTGTVGKVKPKTWKAFVEFSISLFWHLFDELGGVLLADNIATIPPNGGLLVVESFPKSAWQELGIPWLPAKHKAKESDIRSRLENLQRLFNFQVEQVPTHDELQALVSGLAGVPILNCDSRGYNAVGAPPKKTNGAILEGFIVNPTRFPRREEATNHEPRATSYEVEMPTAKTAKALQKASEPDARTLERMLYYLKLTREAEYRIERVLYRQGKIVGGVYVGRGQEAIAVGSAIQLVDGDVDFPSHRDFAAFMIRGIPLPQIFCNWMGRANGPTRGRENTLHIGDLKLGVIPIISPLGDTCPVACGVALTFMQRRKNNVAIVHFGEGTTSRGDVHEAMNLAAVMKLPVIFICNNNAYAYSTPTELQYAVEDLSVRGPAYGMPGVTVDGNDVLAVYEAVGKAIAVARAGEGPSFIECKTFRMTGHSAHDAAEYVPKEVLEREAGKDPIPRFQKLLLAQRVLTQKQVVAMEQKIQKEIDDAVAFADASPLPEGVTAVGGVYCGEDCWWNTSVVRGQ